MNIGFLQSGLGIPSVNLDRSFDKKLLLEKSDSLHLDGWDVKLGKQSISASNLADETLGKSFSDMLVHSLSKVNNLGLSVNEATERVISDPSSIEVSEVAIAAAKASMALGVTKAITDRLITGFRDILNQR